MNLSMIETRLGNLFKNRRETGEKGLPVLSVTMNSGIVNRETLSRKMAPDLPPEKSLLVRSGDIVYNMMRMWQGAVAVVRQDGLVSPAYVVCRPNGNIDSQFAYYFFKTPVMLHKLKSYSHGITGDRLRLYYKDFAAIPVRIPLLKIQKTISEILSVWDTAIKKSVRLVQAKEKNLKGQIQRLISQQCDSWPHIKLKNIFDTITEKNFPNEELLSVTQGRGVIPRNMLEGRVMSPNGTTEGYKRIKRGDFAISLRSFQGGIEYSNCQGIISPAYTVLRPKIELNSDFYRLFFKSYIFIEKYLELAVIGIRDGKQISIPDFLSVQIPFPSLEEQQQIAKILTIAQQEIDLLKQLEEKYKTQKRGLMQKLLTGEVRLN